MPKPTNEQLALAKKYGFSARYDNKIGCSFTKGIRHIWPIYEPHPHHFWGWQTANLVDGQYQEHTKFISLEGALTRPIEEP